MKRSARYSPLLAAVILCIALDGCHPEKPIAASEPPLSPAQTPVGPVPGVGEPPLATNPYANDATAAQAGRKLFMAFNCYGCHGGHAGGGMGPSLRDADWIYGGSDAQIFASIAQGRANGMPAWGTRVPADAIWQLTAYIRSLRTPGEAEPPDQ